jgi:hypothetical protein
MRTPPSECPVMTSTAPLHRDAPVTGGLEDAVVDEDAVGRLEDVSDLVRDADGAALVLVGGIGVRDGCAGRAGAW